MRSFYKTDPLVIYAPLTDADLDWIVEMIMEGVPAEDASLEEKLEYLGLLPIRVPSASIKEFLP